MQPFFLIMKALLVDYSHHNSSFETTRVLFLHYSITGISQNAMQFFLMCKASHNKKQLHFT